MKDLGAIMKQAQAMQEKLAAAQAKLAQLSIEGASGGGMVTVTLKGGGALASVKIDPSLLTADEGEVVEDLIVAAHADAKRKLDAKQADMMREAAGPMAGMMGGAGLPGF